MASAPTRSPTRRSPLQGYFTFGNESEEAFTIVAAGNLCDSGRPAHDTSERFFRLTPDGDVDLAPVAALLDMLSPRVRDLDVRAV